MHKENLKRERELPRKKVTAPAAAILCCLALWPGQAWAQGGAGYSSPASDSAPAPSIQIRSTSNQSPYSGSVAQGTAKPEVVSLTFQDAIDLGLKNNLGVLLQSYNTIAARGQKWKELSELLPNVRGTVSVNV